MSSSTGCAAVRYRGFSCYSTKGSARLASAEVRRKCVMLTVYFALIGFRPSFRINLGFLQLLWFFMAVNAEELFQGWARDSRHQWGKQRDHVVVTRGRQPANSTAAWGNSHGDIPDEASWSWQLLAARGKSCSLSREFSAFQSFRHDISSCSG